MFLWARLVLLSLEDAYSIQELESAVSAFPNELANVYGQILERARARVGVKEYDRLLRILSWMTFAKRPLKGYELQYGIILHSENTCTITDHETKPINSVLDICKPLAEDGVNQTVTFIHSSVKE